MTIERGRAWGEPAADLPATATASGDAAMAALAHEAVEGGDDFVVALIGPGGDRVGEPLVGDVARTLGVQRIRPGDERLAYPFDLGLVRLDDADEVVPFVANVVARAWLWRGEFAIVANCGWRGEWYVGPRAHPNDGLLDTTVGSLGASQRLLARRRLSTGTHLPHPGLTTSRTASWKHRFDRPLRVFADGRSVGRSRSLEVSIEPDRFTVVV